MILRKPAGRRLAEVVFANEVRNGGVGGAGGPEGPKIGMLVGTGSSRRTSILGDFGSLWVGVWWGHVGRRLASQESIRVLCWTHVGACWGDLGSMLASVGVTWGPGRRLMGREGVCIDVHVAISTA